MTKERRNFGISWKHRPYVAKVTCLCNDFVTWQSCRENSATFATDDNISVRWKWKHGFLRVMMNHATRCDFWNYMKHFCYAANMTCRLQWINKIFDMLGDRCNKQIHVVWQDILRGEKQNNHNSSWDRVSLYNPNISCLSPLSWLSSRFSEHTLAPLSCFHNRRRLDTPFRR